MQKHILLYIICCIIAIATLATLAISCGPIKYVPIEKTTYIHDTTTITKTYRDTTIVLRPDTMQKETPIPPSQDTTSFLKNDYAESTASLSGGHLYHTLYTYPRPIDVKIPTIEINQKHFKTEKTSKEIPVEVEVVKYKVPKWCWGLLGINLLAIALFLLKRRFFR